MYLHGKHIHAMAIYILLVKNCRIIPIMVNIIFIKSIIHDYCYILVHFRCYIHIFMVKMWLFKLIIVIYFQHILLFGEILLILPYKMFMFVFSTTKYWTLFYLTTCRPHPLHSKSRFHLTNEKSIYRFLVFEIWSLNILRIFWRKKIIPKDA